SHSPAAPSTPARPAATRTWRRPGPLGVDIRHGSVSGDLPALDGIEVVDRPGTAHGHQTFARGLNVAGVVRGAALEHGRLPIPGPRVAEARVTAREHRLRELGVAPALPAVHADLHPRDAP